MKKLMNQPGDFVDQSLKGIVAAHPNDYMFCNGDIRAIACARKPPVNQTVIVTGGGYGHLPVFLGYVGQGLCDGVAVGNVFTSPSCESILNVSRQVHAGGGILFLFGNYTGDGMNFSMAKEFLSMENIQAEIVTVSDDVASAPREKYEERRGIAGIAFAYKVAGACAQCQHPLEEVKRIAKKTIENTATYGVAFSSCTLPDIGKPMNEMGENEMEVGMGIHGEPGVLRTSMRTSAALAQELTSALLNDLSARSGDRMAVLVNGLGATSREELYIFYNDVAPLLSQAGIQVHSVYVGEYATSLEMAGASLSLLKLDDELTQYLDMDAFSPFISFRSLIR